jgi:hypothetical protein
MEIIVSGNTITQAIVTEINNEIIIQQPQTSIVELTAPGPQGPAFAGQQFFNLASIGNLSAVDSGVTLRWDGSQFLPANTLSEGLTVFGGAF